MEIQSNKLTLSVAELAQYLGIGKNSAYSLVNSSGFPSLKIGKKFIVPIKALEQWLENQISN